MAIWPPEVPVTLAGLVERYSPSGEEGEAAAWLAERMRKLGFHQATVDPIGNAVGVLGDGPRQIVLLGHIDTVPGEIPPRLEGDLLYGRGSVDAKGPLAAFVDAAAQVGPVPGWQLAVIGAVREETDSAGARAVVEAFLPQFAVIGEPNRWERVALGYKGSAWLQVTARQPLAHTARQEQSACEAALAAWEQLGAWAQGFNQDRTAVFNQVQLSLRGFHSGRDGFEEWAELRIGVRLPLDLPPTALLSALDPVTAPAQVALLPGSIPAHRTEKHNPLVRAFLGAIRSQGGQPGFVLKTGTADFNIVAPAWGCPAVVYGPGDSALDHTPNEHISLVEYARAVKVLVTVLKQLTGQGIADKG